jgi:hypothetical protein
MAACKLRDVFCHATGASIQPRGLSIAMTARSSYKIGIGSQSGSSMELGLAINILIQVKQSFGGSKTARCSSIDIFLPTLLHPRNILKSLHSLNINPRLLNMDLVIMSLNFGLKAARF